MTRVPDVRMSWCDLLFLHWPVPASALRDHIPASLEIDEFGGSAWVALVPFRMADSRFRGFGWVPGLRDFYECNVRTYVRAGGRSGVWFFSLDAANLLPVLGGRWVWRLNYVHARFDVAGSADAGFRYGLRRRSGPWAPGETRVCWTPGQRLPPAEPGSLEHFLTERYWLFTERFGRLMAGEVRHAPWRLRKAEVERWDNGLFTAAGVDIAGDPLALASDRIDVAGYGLIPAAGGESA